MSKERELLQSVMEESWDFLYAGTHTEIKELLAQPEQKPEPEQKPLSDEAVCEILLKKEWKGFVELVRIIEKTHGIGGGNDE